MKWRKVQIKDSMGSTRIDRWNKGHKCKGNICNNTTIISLSFPTGSK